MLFNSIEFAIFLPIIFVIYWLFFKTKTQGRNLFLIVASYIFYGYWDWRFLSLLFFTSVLDFYFGKQLGFEQNEQKRKRWIQLSVLVNLSVLGFFKYFNFFVDSFVTSFTFLGVHPQISTLNIILPVGISFYTFQSLSYTLDIYYNKLQPVKELSTFLAFVSFFPQLVAGPIERAKHLIPQFSLPKNIDYEKLRYGLFMIACGLFKKVVIADRLAIFINKVYGNLEQADGIPSLLAIIFFAFQLYFDFAGYSDIAIGTAKLFDFDLMTNFRRPYLATSFTDFWKRWHISLSSWFKDYLYLPLGGNKMGQIKTIRNILLVFILSGLWHGASWNFVFWGLLNASFYLILDRILPKQQKNILLRILTSILIFFCWTLSLVFFRAQTFPDALTLYSKIGIGNVDNILNYGFSTFEMYFIVILLAIIVLIEIAQEKSTNLYGWFCNQKGFLRWALYFLLGLSFILFGAYGMEMSDNLFIYFQF